MRLPDRPLPSLVRAAEKQVESAKIPINVRKTGPKFGNGVKCCSTSAREPCRACGCCDDDYVEDQGLFHVLALYHHYLLLSKYNSLANSFVDFYAVEYSWFSYLSSCYPCSLAYFHYYLNGLMV